MSESQTVVLRRGKPTPPSAIRFARDLLLREGAWQERTLICLSEPQDCVEMTYRELRENAEKAAANLQAMGIGCGDSVCVSVCNRASFLTAFWGVVLSGAAAIPIERTAFGRPKEEAARSRIASIQRIAQPKVMITDWLEQVGSVPIATPEQLTAQPAQAWNAQPLDDEHVMMILFTSGSTGQPKGVPITERMLRANLAGHAAAFPFTDEDIFLNWMPLDHSAAMVQAHLLPVYMQSAQIQISTNRILSEPAQWMQLASAYQVTISWAPNFAYELTDANIKPPRPLDLSHIRCLFSAGETVTRTACEHFVQQWAPFGLQDDVIHVGWGMTETAGYMLTSRGWKHNASVGSICSTGEPIAGVEVGVQYREDGYGELLVRGDTVAQTYVGGCDEMCCDADGWLHSGDEIFVQGDTFVIVGRQKDIFIRNGRNISCAEMEACVLQELSGDCAKVVCVVLPDTDSGRDKLAVFAVCDPQNQAACSEQLHRVLIAYFGFSYDVLIFVSPEQIPRTSVGKIRRKTLRQLLESGALTPYREPEMQPCANEFQEHKQHIEKMLALWQTVLHNTQLTEQDNFFFSGGSSAQIPRLLAMIADTFGRTIHATDILNAPTVVRLVKEVFAEQKEENQTDDVLEDIDILDI